MANINLKEKSNHGTAMFPFHIYSHLDSIGNYSVPFHWHNEIEIIYIEKGELKIDIDMVTIIAKPGDYFFINSEQLHLINSVDNKASLHHAIVFSPQILSSSYFDYCEINYIIHILNNIISFPTSLPKNSKVKKKILKDILDMINIYKTSNNGWQLNIKSSLYKIISLLISEDMLLNKKNIKSIKKDYKIDLIKKILNYIHENYNDKIYIEDLALEANMNVQYFCRFFKSVIGKTPVEYINSYRIEKATELLQTETLSISNIALSVGIDNFSYFVKQFKKYKNCTPSQYRKSL